MYRYTCPGFDSINITYMSHVYSYKIDYQLFGGALQTLMIGLDGEIYSFLTGMRVSSRESEAALRDSLLTDDEKVVYKNIKEIFTQANKTRAKQELKPFIIPPTQHHPYTIGDAIKELKEDIKFKRYLPFKTTLNLEGSNFYATLEKKLGHDGSSTLKIGINHFKFYLFTLFLLYDEDYLEGTTDQGTLKDTIEGFIVPFVLKVAMNELYSPGQKKGPFEFQKGDLEVFKSLLLSSNAPRFFECDILVLDRYRANFSEVITDRVWTDNTMNKITMIEEDFLSFFIYSIIALKASLVTQTEEINSMQAVCRHRMAGILSPYFHQARAGLPTINSVTLATPTTPQSHLIPCHSVPATSISNPATVTTNSVTLATPTTPQSHLIPYHSVPATSISNPATVTTSLTMTPKIICCDPIVLIDKNNNCHAWDMRFASQFNTQLPEFSVTTRSQFCLTRLSNAFFLWSPTSSKIYAMGDNWARKLPVKSTEPKINELTPVVGLPENVTPIYLVSCCDSLTIIIASDNRIYTTKFSPSGSKLIQKDLLPPSVIPIHVATGGENVCFIGSDNHLYLYKLYNMNLVKIHNLSFTSSTNPIQVVLGRQHIVVLCSDDSLFVYGDNEYGQLGLGDNRSRSTFEKVNLPAHIKPIQVVCGEFHTVILTSNGRCYATGWNDSGQLGIGNELSQNTFTKMLMPPSDFSAPFTIEQLASNSRHIIMVSSGFCYVTGLNNEPTLTSIKQDDGQDFNNVAHVECEIGTNIIVIVTKDGKCFYKNLSNSNFNHELKMIEGEQRVKNITVDIDKLTSSHIRATCHTIVNTSMVQPELLSISLDEIIQQFEKALDQKNSPLRQYVQEKRLSKGPEYVKFITRFITKFTQRSSYHRVTFFNLSISLGALVDILCLTYLIFLISLKKPDDHNDSAPFISSINHFISFLLSGHSLIPEISKPDELAQDKINVMRLQMSRPDSECLEPLSRLSFNGVPESLGLLYKRIHTNGLAKSAMEALMKSQPNKESYFIGKKDLELFYFLYFSYDILSADASTTEQRILDIIFNQMKEIHDAIATSATPQAHLMPWDPAH